MTRTPIFLGILSVAVLATPALAAQAEPNCEQWNTKEFFQATTGEDVTACLEAGADVAARTEDGHTPLHEAASNENPAVLAALVADGASLETRDDNGNMLLHFAARNNGNPAVIETLLAAGANLEARNDTDHTPLHQAAFIDNLAAIQALWVNP